MRASKVTSGIPISWRTGGAAIAFPDDRANRAVNTIRTAKNNNLSFDFIFFTLLSLEIRLLSKKEPLYSLRLI
jgi:hypothetical protein